MQFKALPVITAVLSFSQAATALSAQDVVDNIVEITKLSKDTIDVAQEVSGGNLGAGLKLVGNFKGIIDTVAKDVSGMPESSSGDEFKEKDQKSICEAFTNFVEVHQKLLNIVIGEVGVLSKIPIAGPAFAGVLRVLEDGVDKLAFGIIEMVPTCEGQAKEDLEKLDGTIEKSIMEFSGKAPQQPSQPQQPQQGGGLLSGLTNGLLG